MPSPKSGASDFTKQGPGPAQPSPPWSSSSNTPWNWAGLPCGIWALCRQAHWPFGVRYSPSSSIHEIHRHITQLFLDVDDDRVLGATLVDVAVATEVLKLFLGQDTQHAVQVEEQPVYPSIFSRGFVANTRFLTRRAEGSDGFHPGRRRPFLEGRPFPLDIRTNSAVVLQWHTERERLLANGTIELPRNSIQAQLQQFGLRFDQTGSKTSPSRPGLVLLFKYPFWVRLLCGTCTLCQQAHSPVGVRYTVKRKGLMTVAGTNVVAGMVCSSAKVEGIWQFNS
ncbi:hypothetical protein Vadar_005141 [Vaccinium darrowii]|uniref:Uncharacterized protein n=1 Tax=Vaccinium darrowii TaxID=229202 RepID=A0ACB7Z3A7_9ERIC|nr:hypothetical protein Vadar_005141 [Vaccinium darrowii]